LGKFGDQARKRLSPLLHAGEQLLAAAVFKGPIGGRGPVTAHPSTRRRMAEPH
jgi:hypothetical protein